MFDQDSRVSGWGAALCLTGTVALSSEIGEIGAEWGMRGACDGGILRLDWSYACPSSPSPA